MKSIWRFIRPYLAVSKILAFAILYLDYKLTNNTLNLCYLAVNEGFTGSLPFLTALIGMYQLATGYVLGKYFDKSKAENTIGGITYDTTVSGCKPTI